MLAEWRRKRFRTALSRTIRSSRPARRDLADGTRRLQGECQVELISSEGRQCLTEVFQCCHDHGAVTERLGRRLGEHFLVQLPCQGELAFAQVGRCEIILCLGNIVVVLTVVLGVNVDRTSIVFLDLVVFS